MRKHAIAVTVVLMLLIFGLSAGRAAAAGTKIGVVNFQLILETSKRGKAAQAELTAAKKRMEDDLKQKKAELEELRGRLEREAMVMSAEAREEKEREMRIKMNDFKELQRQYTTDLQKMERGLMADIQKAVTEQVKALAEKEGFELILGNLAVVYAKDSIDVTAKVIRQLDAKGGK